MGKKRALLVAINDYNDAPDLGSCIADLQAMEAIIQQDHGITDIQKLEGSQATIANVEAGLKTLFAGATFGDQLLFFYSGHGTQIRQGTNLEEALYLYDGVFIDDKLTALAKDLPQGVLTVFLDSCFSGGMEKRLIVVDRFDNLAAAKWTLETNVGKGTSKALDTVSGITSYRPFGCFPLPIKHKLTDETLFKAFSTAKDAGDEAGQLLLNGILIAASSENKTAAANTFMTMGLSAFTYCFRDVLASNPNASVKYLVDQSNQLLLSMGHGQTPVVKANPDVLAGNAFLSSTTGTKGIYPPPQGFSGIWAGVGRKSPESYGQDKVFGIDDAILIPAIAGVITAAINANKKTVDDKIFGIDDAILIPIVASVITTAINASSKSLDISIGVGISLKAPEIAKAVVEEMKAGGSEKVFGIDDAILIPAVASVIISAINAATKGIGISIGGGVVTPIGGGSFGGSVTIKGASDKVFGIDDAILIPAIAAVVTAAINASTKSAGPQQKLIGIDDAIIIPAIVSVVTAAINAASKGQDKNAISLPADPFSDNDLFDRIRRFIQIEGGSVSNSKIAGIDDAILIPALVSVITAAINARS